MAAALLGACYAFVSEQTVSNGPEDTSVEKSVTVFPIVLNSGAPTPGISADMSKNMADVVGLMLERGGMKKIEIADAKFILPEKADLAKAAEAFGQFEWRIGFV